MEAMLLRLSYLIISLIVLFVMRHYVDLLLSKWFGFKLKDQIFVHIGIGKKPFELKWRVVEYEKAIEKYCIVHLIKAVFFIFVILSLRWIYTGEIPNVQLVAQLKIMDEINAIVSQRPISELARIYSMTIFVLVLPVLWDFIKFIFLVVEFAADAVVNATFGENDEIRVSINITFLLGILFVILGVLLFVVLKPPF